MFSRHVDFFAVVVIILGLLGFSDISSLQSISPENSMHLQNAFNSAMSHVRFDPLPDNVVSTIAHIVDR
jgi:hypothetical protein